MGKPATVSKCYRVEWTMAGHAGEFVHGACVNTINEALDFTENHIKENYSCESFDIFCITLMD